MPAEEFDDLVAAEDEHHRMLLAQAAPSDGRSSSKESNTVMNMVGTNLAAAPKGAPRGYTVPVWVTIVMSDDGTKMGNVDDKMVKAQLKALNDAYGTATAESNIKWEYKLMGIKRVVGPSMCDEANEIKMKKMHRQGKATDLNLYITDLSECGLLGFSSWPWDIKKGVHVDGVVIHFDTLPGGKYKPYNLGRTAIHEIGHWHGLYHVFQNGCSKGGDLIEDTPFASNPSEGCPRSKDTCPQPGRDPFENFMDYTDDSCMRFFTGVQHRRMEVQWKMYRLT